jgi:phospholipid/cholesterol/gamma-HCH transport system substrate-binding protein
MSKRYVEVSVGIFVLLGIAALFYLAIQVSNIAEYRDRDTYEVVAYFDHIGGLKVRAPVTVSGVRVGRVSAIRYDPERFQAQVILAIQSSQNYFPADTLASIFTAGLLGEQYVALEPGGDFELLRAGDEILFTQPALVLENLVGRFLTNLSGN